MKKLFENEILVILSVIWAYIVEFLFPTDILKTSAVAVLIIMALDLLTKIFALSKKNGGLLKALKAHKISSAKFAKGTLDKLIIFGVMLIISASAYRLIAVDEIATWFTQIVFTLMFLHDVLSIIENLSDAGIQGLGIFKKLIKKKIETVCEEQGIEPEEGKK